MKRREESKAPRGYDWPRALRAGTGAAWPIFLGYVPIGVAFGVLAQKGGLGPFEVGLMSLLVFAGSAQFIAVSMLAAGAGASAVVATTFVVNLRHLLMSSALAPHLHQVGHGWLALFAYGITDESFAVNHARFSRGGWHWRPALAVNQSACAVWVTGTMAGAWAGRFIPQGAFGIDYALIAMFLCLLVFQLRGRRHAVTAAISGALAVGLSLVLPGNAYIILSTVLAATFGTLALRGRAGGRGGASEGTRNP
ncbi:MAG: AzlC family ABC transporter permease [Deltaproteobacteria bacterium]|nr:AzlC family ABC transporter permease [Deltaproteobacteria bacterium]